MVSDLRKDAALVREMLERCVVRYSAGHASKVGEPFHPPVTRIDFVYSLGDGVAPPWVNLNLDTKPGAKQDGNPTHPLFDLMEHHQWGSDIRYLLEDGDNTMPVILPNGKLTECDAGAFEQHIGKLLVYCLEEARYQKVFDELPKAAQYALGVEMFGGGFGWNSNGKKRRK